ncbi:MAG: hypothetical protein GOU97_01835 [Nanoarchaeota archaeon]|nr:hypothetical protein [Nanoarchaeota archaeon]
MNAIEKLTQECDFRKLPEKYAKVVVSGINAETPKELIWFLKYKEQASDIIGRIIMAWELGDLETSPVVFTALQIAFLNDLFKKLEGPRKKIIKIKIKQVEKRLVRLVN